MSSETRLPLQIPANREKNRELRDFAPGQARSPVGMLDQRTVLVEFDDRAHAIAAHDSPGYQAALAILGNATERDLRIVEGA